MNEISLLKRILSALFFAGASVFLVFVNKIILTSYRFPSFLCLALGQAVAAVLILGVARLAHLVHFPLPSKKVLGMVFPLPLLFVVNVVSGLGSTQSLSLPMFVALRRFSILLAMLGDIFLRKAPVSRPIQASVFLMIFGGVIAAFDDLTFDLHGYTLITINNVATAGNQVYTRIKLDATELGKWGILFYNALFAAPGILALCIYFDDMKHVPEYAYLSNPWFVILFLASCVSGFILNYSMVLCTEYNSPLTTACVGSMKNIFVTYGGMFVGGDYVYSFFNFVGINVSVVGSVLYSYLLYWSPKPQGQQQKSEEDGKLFIHEPDRGTKL